MSLVKAALAAVRAFFEAHGIFTSDPWKVWVQPLVLGAGTMIFGVLDKVPVAYAIVAATAAAAFSATARLRTDEWRERTDPSGKLVFEGPLFFVDGEIEDDGLLTKSIQFGISLQNRASFPITYEVEQIETRFLGRVGEPAENYRKIIDTDANTFAFYRDAAIPVNLRAPLGAAVGRLRFRISYWRDEKKKFVIERQLKIEHTFNTGRKQSAFTWVYE